jgi:hypothetical protein
MLYLVWKHFHIWGSVFPLSQYPFLCLHSRLTPCRHWFFPLQLKETPFISISWSLSGERWVYWNLVLAIQYHPFYGHMPHTPTRIDARSLKWKKNNKLTDDLDFQGHWWLISMKTLGSYRVHLLRCMKKSAEVSRSLDSFSFRSKNMGRFAAELYGCCLGAASFTSFYLVEFHLNWSAILIAILSLLWSSS